MRDNLSKFAPAVFGAGVIALLLGAVVIASGVTAGSGRGPIPTEYMLIGGFALIVVSALMRPEAVRNALGIRSVRYGGNALIISLGFLAILGLINYLGTQSRFDWRTDFTANQQFTLSPQTIQILENLKAPVKVTAFYSAGNPRQEADDRLKEYKRHSSNFDYEIVDPFERPDLARQLGVTRDGGIVFQSGAKKQEAISASESDFTSALLKVTTEKERAVVFIGGHRERDPNEFGETGFSTVRQWLEKDNYSVQSANLALTSTLPASVTVVVLASPQVALSDAEAKVLGAYLDQGGRLLVMGDPGDPEPIPAILAKWGVQFNNDEVVEPAAFLQGTSPVVPAVTQYPFSVITQKLNNRITIFPLTRSLKRLEPVPASVTTQGIVQTSVNSWGETTLDSNVQPKYDEGKDNKGPLDLVTTIEGTAPISATTASPAPASARKTRIVVMGNSEFVGNSILQAQQLRGIANIDLFMNSINWLAEDEALISIRPTTPDQHSVVVTGGQVNAIFLLTVIVLPALVLIAGLSIWWRRR